MSDRWRPYFQNLSPAYSIFSWLKDDWLQPQWPSIEQYNCLSLNKVARNFYGIDIRFVSQQNDHYEQRIFELGEVQTRSENWHDFFNMLIWLTFPRIKAKLNHLHYEQGRIRNGQHRTPLQDFLTVFDENGLMIISTDPDLLSLIRDMAWKELFWQRRSLLKTALKCFVFGHSLHEKLLQPYIGMVGHALLFLVDPQFLLATEEEQVTIIQDRFETLNLAVLTTRDLVPLPILGLPDWYAGNDCPEFYDNKAYFRSSRFGKRSMI